MPSIWVSCRGAVFGSSSTGESWLSKKRILGMHYFTGITNIGGFRLERRPA